VHAADAIGSAGPVEVKDEMNGGANHGQENGRNFVPEQVRSEADRFFSARMSIAEKCMQRWKPSIADPLFRE
jgi:hypothetical protein